MVRIYKNLKIWNGRQAGVRLFARSFSIRKTSVAQVIYSPEPDDFFFMGTLQRYVAQRK